MKNNYKFLVALAIIVLALTITFVSVGCGKSNDIFNCVQLLIGM